MDEQIAMAKDTKKMELDPLDWTIDRVMAFLCQSLSTRWSQSANPSERPDPVSLEAALRENRINGEVLLNDVNEVSLREDLGLKALGHRSTVLAAIRYLQQLSAKYQRANSAKIQGKLLSFILYSKH
jgi:hypothetical protein